MKITSEQKLENFEFWSQARQNAMTLTDKELDEVEIILEDIYPDGIDKTTLNDIFWFDFETVLEWLGKSDEDEEE